MSVLLIIYAGYAGYAPNARTYSVPADQCRKLAAKTRAKVSAGKAWMFCNGVRA